MRQSNEMTIDGGDRGSDGHVTRRMHACFERLTAAGEGAFIPFLVLGDPDLETSSKLLRAAIEAGADALEVGIPFSDPIADGPVIQAAAQRALQSGVTPESALRLIAELRAQYEDTPIGLLTYANLVVHGGMTRFYDGAARAGLDTVLVADVPTIEAESFSAAARAARLAPVLIAPPDMSDGEVARLAQLCDGYTYCIARSGVTGADEEVQLHHRQLFSHLRAHGAPPPVVGFGISRPEHVRATLQAGAAGVISGSAVVSRIAGHLHEPARAIEQVGRFIRQMKDATVR